MKDNRGVFVVNKMVGETPLETINRFRDENKKENPELDFLPITYAGRLDPMAEGLLILLVGDEVKNKEKYLDLPKTYEFEVLWGMGTDSLDLLGLVEFKIQNFTPLETKQNNFINRVDYEADNSVVSNGVKNSKQFPNTNEIQGYLKNSVGRFEQMYPAYSSRPVNGKPLFEWAREGKVDQIMIPKHEVEIYKADYVERREIKKEDLLQHIVAKIDTVRGDFRQDEIKQSWLDVLEKSKTDIFVIDKIKVEVSSGFYVRQFAFDMGQELGIPATTFSIKRIKIGEFI